MQKLIALILLLMPFGLRSTEFVLFTQPKTATHFLIPILTDLTGKSVYWAPEYAKTSPPLQHNEGQFFQSPQFFIFSIDRMPWSKQTMDLVWQTNKGKGSFLHLHAPFSQTMENYLANEGYINFFVKRDPRDQIVSLLNHYKHINYNDKEVELLPSDDEKLLYLIKKYSKAHTTHYMGWLSSPVCCVLEFEKLMGSHGGTATDADALLQMRAIASALRLDLSDEYLSTVYRKSFGTGWSFFSGTVGSWKRYFNDEHKALVKQEIGDLLIQLDYEKNYEW